MNREARRQAAKQQAGSGAAPQAEAAQLLAVAGEHHRAGRLADAERLYLEIIRSSPGAAEARRRLGCLYAQIGRSDAALTQLGTAVRLSPGNAIYQNDLGSAYLAAKRPAEAEEAYRRAAALKPDFAAAHFNLGNLLRLQEKREAAAACYRQAIAAAPAAPQAYIHLGVTLQEMMRYDEAVEVLRHAVAVAPRSFEAHYNLAHVLETQRRVDEAIIAYRAALTVHPQAAPALVNLGALLQVQGKTDEAIACYERAVAAAPGLRQAHINLSAAHQARGDIPAAVAAMQRALTLDDRTPKMHASLALMLRQLGDMDGAEAAFRRALQLDPGHVFAKAHFSFFLQQLGKAEEARSFIDYGRMIRTPRLEQVEGWPSVAAFNAELARYVYDHPTLMGDPPGKSIRQGQQTLEILNTADRPIVPLQRFFEQSVSDYMTEIMGQGRPFRLEGWAVVLRSTGYQLSHFHHGAIVSGCYYVQVPDVVRRGDGGEAGFIRFGEPSLDTPGIETPTELMTLSVRPEEGKLVLFPAHFWHRVLPFESAQDRICIAFDVIPLGAAG